MTHITRRDWLKLPAATLAGSYLLAAVPKKPEPKKVAAVVTVYRKNSHADVLVGKILEGWKQDCGAGPSLKLASLYVDQFPKGDISRELCKKFNVPIFDTIEKAVTVGGTSIPVDGVISVGEHGDYPINDKGQHLYPRRRFFEAITDTFEKYNRVVPVFSDKHIGPVWEDAKWMYDRAVKMKVPFMAGSSLPLTFRSPEIDVPMGCEIESAVGIGYHLWDVYGSHALDCYQTLVERRRNAEKGVKSVQYLQGDAVWKAVDDGRINKSALDTAFELAPKIGKKEPHKNMRLDTKVSATVFEYVDGFRGAMLLFSCIGRITVALKLKGETKPVATGFEEREQPKYPHFAYLLKAIETMIHTSKPSYPVERNLLVSGILDRTLTSKSKNSDKIDTPELAIAYKPVDYPHAPKPELP